uniref:Uncharacterized protein n=1 Tax=Musca domestica TaxID=7370 RepID=A0A1I8NJ95_MUSDO
MINHASLNRLARKLKLLNDPETTLIPNSVKQDLIREKVRSSLHQAYLRNEKSYNLRSRQVKFIPGQEVIRRSFRQSGFKNNYNAKLDKKFFKCRIVKPVGKCLYEIEDLKGHFSR